MRKCGLEGEEGRMKLGNERKGEEVMSLYTYCG